jgi:hypothetical protein
MEAMIKASQEQKMRGKMQTNWEEMRAMMMAWLETMEAIRRSWRPIKKR